MKAEKGCLLSSASACGRHFQLRLEGMKAETIVIADQVGNDNSRVEYNNSVFGNDNGSVSNDNSVEW